MPSWSRHDIVQHNLHAQQSFGSVYLASFFNANSRLEIDDVALTPTSPPCAVGVLPLHPRFGIMPQTVAQKLREKTGYAPVPQHDGPWTGLGSDPQWEWPIVCLLQRGGWHNLPQKETDWKSIPTNIQSVSFYIRFFCGLVQTMSNQPTVAIQLIARKSWFWLFEANIHGAVLLIYYTYHYNSLYSLFHPHHLYYIVQILSTFI